MRPTAALLLTLGLAPVAAMADDCQTTVKDAYDKLAIAPAVRQVMTMQGSQTMQMVVLGDTLYMDQGEGGWMKMPLQPGMRQQMLQQTLPDASVLAECKELGGETIEGAAMTVYQYVPPSIAGETPTPQKVWIGDDDGLPHRMTIEQGDAPMQMTLGYDGVTAPIQ